MLYLLGLEFSDYATGFGGKYGVQKDRQDGSAVGFDHTEKLSKHSSQKDYSTGFGGKYGVQSDRKDEVRRCLIHIIYFYMFSCW